MVLPDKQFEELYNAFTTYNSKAKAKANAKQKHYEHTIKLAMSST